MHLKSTKNILSLFKIIFLGIFLFPIFVFASTTDGTIVKAVSTDGYAWGENVGWINFGTPEGNVHVTSAWLTGYAWDAIYGWVNLSPTGSGVVNDGNGNLSGFAWSAGTGFIDFTGVSINSSGKFIGQAQGTTYGRINFSCSTCNVVTDWRSMTTPPVQPPSSGGGGSAIPVTPYTITATAGAGGSIFSSGIFSITAGGSQTFDITPNIGYDISNVIVDDISQGAISTYTFSDVTTNHKIIATFVVIPVTTGTPTPPENVFPPEITPPGQNNEITNSPPAETSENPISSQPVIDTSGMPVINTGSGKTFTTPSQPVISNNNLPSLDLLKLYNDFLANAKKVFKDLVKIINTPTGSAVTKSISTLGIISSLSVPLVSLSFSDLWLALLRFIGLLLGAIGLKKKSRSWGTVYDSVTKRPLDPVYVSLINAETNKEVSGAITDIDGRYGFLVLPGKYKIVATKTNYIQPSKKMAGKSFDEVYNDLYFGEEIVVTEEGQIITKNIPMDSLSFDWNEFAKTKMNVNKFIRQRDITWAKISGVIFFIGAIVAFVAVFAAPEPYNYIIAGFYVLAYILNYSVLKTKKSGTLTERNTGAPLSFAIVSIFREDEEVPLTKKIADKFGSYYALLPKGKYYIKVAKKNDDTSYTEIFKSSVVNIKSGLINEDLSL